MRKWSALLVFAITAAAIVVVVGLAGTFLGDKFSITAGPVGGTAGPSHIATTAEKIYVTGWVALLGGCVAAAAFLIYQLGQHHFRRRGPWG